MKMKKYKYAVVGIFGNSDCAVEGTYVQTYKEALRIKKEWEQEEKYLKVFIDRVE